MNDLKRCPFCGGGAQIITVVDNDGDRYQAVECRVCYVQTDGYMTEEKATEAWNKRVPQVEVNQYGDDNTYIHNVGTMNLNW